MATTTIASDWVPYIEQSLESHNQRNKLAKGNFSQFLTSALAEPLKKVAEAALELAKAKRELAASLIQPEQKKAKPESSRRTSHHSEDIKSSIKYMFTVKRLMHRLANFFSNELGSDFFSSDHDDEYTLGELHSNLRAIKPPKPKQPR